MEEERIPRPGEIYNHFKDKPYQIISIATHSETRERMVVYQALYGNFETYVRPLEMFISEVDREKYPEVKQKNRFELRKNRDTQVEQWNGTEITQVKELSAPSQIEPTNDKSEKEPTNNKSEKEPTHGISEIRQLQVGVSEGNFQTGTVNSILLEFLDATSYTRKLNIITGNIKHLNDRLINDMAVSLDCAVEEGPIEKRIQELIFCLQAMCRFEDRRLR